MGSLTELQTIKRSLESSLQEAQEKIKRLEQTVREKDQALREKDEQLQDLRSKLDKYQSIEQVRRKQRTVGISAEPRRAQNLHELGHADGFKTYPKPASSKDFIRQAILANDFLKLLSSTNINEIVDCMQLADYKKETLIIKEGDNGSKLFVLDDGQLEVTKDGRKLCNMGPGKVFGELAILYNCTRTASVTALTPCRLWEIERDVFQGIVMQTELQRQKQCIELLKSVPRFQSAGDQTINKLADAVEELHFEPNHYIVRQGQKSDAFFIIVKGAVKETELKPGSAEETTIRRIERGGRIGESALDLEEIRKTNLIVADPDGVDCLKLDRLVYTQLISKLSTSVPPLTPSKEDDSLKSLKGPLTVTNGTINSIDLLQMSDLVNVATIGVGGFGRVELVRPQNDLNKTYALKRMKKYHIVETRQQEHILNEKTIMYEARCDFIVRLYKTYKDNKYLYMLLEACLGGELWAVLRDKNSFDDATARFYAGCVVEALSYLHSRNIVYRDLKPENLLLDNSGYIKLVDFGFAKKLGGVGRKTWTFCGTPEYVAPEIILNRGHDLSADLWSLGILTYELLTGSPPFTSGDPMKTYSMILKGFGGVDFPRKIGQKAQHFIKKLCKNDPSERLGCGGAIKDIQKYKWFEGLNWEALRKRTLKAPYVPQVKSATDTSNFDSYPPDESGLPPDDLTGWDKDF